MNTNQAPTAGTESSCPHAHIFRGCHYPPDVITFAVRYYLRYKLSYRDVAEILAERGVRVHHVTIWRWVRRFTPILAHSARRWRRTPAYVWRVDETYVRVGGERRYVYRAIDYSGQVIDIYVSARRNTDAARAFFDRAICAVGDDVEIVISDKDGALAAAIASDLDWVGHDTTKYLNNAIEGDHSQLKSRWRAMRGVKTDEAAQIVIEGHAFVQNIARGFYTPNGKDVPKRLRVKTVFDQILQAA